MVEVARITIVKQYDDDADGAEAIVTTYSTGLSLVDALGMLAFSQATALADFGDDS